MSKLCSNSERGYRGLTLALTEDGGQILKDMGWVEAKDLKVGDISLLG